MRSPGGGDDRNGGGHPHRPWLLDVRHDHHLRPYSREHPADAAVVDPDDLQRVALGDDPALPGDDVHHAAADRRAVLLRRTRSRTSRSRCSSASEASYSSIFIAAPLLAMEGARARVRRRMGQPTVDKTEVILLGPRRPWSPSLPVLPELAPVAADLPASAGDGDADGEGASASSKRQQRQQRRQRRRGRPHGRR